MKERRVGTISMGIRCPIIREGDNLVDIAVDSVLGAAESEGFELRDRDVIALTESIVARAQGNYASIQAIADDVRAKLGGETVGVIFPILSRNRFSICLRGIAMGCKKVVLMFNYPSDEVGNALLTYDELDEKGVNPYSDVLSLEKYRELFGEERIHEFTGVDYVSYYAEVIREAGAEVEIVFANQAKTILDYTDCVINCDIHTRARTKRLLKAAGAKVVCGMDDILNAPVNGSGFNAAYGLLGSNKATEDSIKLFPQDCKQLVLDIQAEILKRTGKCVEVMVYGDGAFKDPQGKIWELADPVVSPAYTDGLIGTPNELKIKYLADNDFANLSGAELKEAIAKSIANKGTESLVGNMASQGTTPRQLTDLIGSLCDLTSGSGDKGTPIILIQGYFDNFTSN
ncbi:MAG: coenzyme F420-0:L-glutamate ligase [Lachnospiraceae bacterium]|nr:coenzyme F420-0:L-glutamate ligase [Lachnospiraceae bacterium]